MNIIPKPTKSILDVARPTRYSFGHAAILVDPDAKTVTFGWYSPAGYGDDPLSFTGGLLPPQEGCKYNESTLPLADAAISRKAAALRIRLEEEVETAEWQAAEEAAQAAKIAEEAAQAVALPAQAMAELDVPRDAMQEDGIWEKRQWRILTRALYAKGISTSIAALKEKTDQEIREMLA